MTPRPARIPDAPLPPRSRAAAPKTSAAPTPAAAKPPVMPSATSRGLFGNSETRKAAARREGRVSTTLAFQRDHLDWLDAQARQIHRSGGAHLTRSELLTHILDGIIAAGVDVTAATNGADVEGKIRGALR